MGFSLKWLIEGHVVLVKSGLEIEDGDIASLDEQIFNCFEQAKSQFVHVIYDIRDTPVKPDLKQAAKVRHTKDSRLGWSCIVEEFNPMISFVITLAAKIHKSRYKNLNSVEEALEFLASVDQTIDFDLISDNNA